MDQVLDHQAGDLIVETQAGARLAELQAVVGKEGQRLVLDETVPGASVGGTLATNASGPQRVLVGTARDLLIGITVVRADGVVAKAGGRVVKNVAGYDLGKLMIGSFGTLRSSPRRCSGSTRCPRCSGGSAIEVDDPAAAHDAVQSVVHAQVVPAAVEVDQPVDGRATVTVLLGGKAEGVEGRVRTTRQLLGEHAEVAEHAPVGWSSYPWQPGETGLKLTCVLSGLRDVLRDRPRRWRRRCAARAAPACCTPRSPTQNGRWRPWMRLRATCARHQGAAVVVDAPPEVKQARRRVGARRRPWS